MWLNHNPEMIHPDFITVRFAWGYLLQRYYPTENPTGLVVITKDNRFVTHHPPSDTPQSAMLANDRLNTLRVIQHLNGAGLDALVTELLTPSEETDGAIRLQVEKQARRLLLMIRLIRSQKCSADMPVGVLAMQHDIRFSLMAAQRAPDEIHSVLWLDEQAGSGCNEPVLRMPFLHVRAPHHQSPAHSAWRVPDETAQRITDWFKRSLRSRRLNHTQPAVA